MPFELDANILVLACAAISTVLFAEAAYLLFFSTASYRSRVNRRLKLMNDQPDREAILIQLRRERGLTSDYLALLAQRSGLFAERTGFPPTIVRKELDEAERRGLLVRDHERIKPTPLGRRFLNDLQAIFLRDDPPRGAQPAAVPLTGPA